MLGYLSLQRLFAFPRRKGLGPVEFASLARQRRRLSELDPHLLRDIGVTPDEAAREAERPVWDVPRHWRA